MKKVFFMSIVVFILIFVNGSNIFGEVIPTVSKTAVFDYSLMLKNSIIKSEENFITSETIKADIPFSDVGVHWIGNYPLGSEILIEIRTSKDSNFWAKWQKIAIESYPDENPKREFFSFLIGIDQIDRTHEYIQYRVTLIPNEKMDSPLLEKLSFTFINSGVSSSSSNILESIKGQYKMEYNGILYSKPTVVSRAGWEANESYRTWVPEYRTVTHNIIHHSDTPNNDTDWKSRIRSIYYYHAITKGWGDIGYNYLVDPNGVLYEGRYGGDDVIAGHTYGYNEGTLGLCFLGSYGGGSYGGITTPSSSMLSSSEKLLAWKCSQKNINPLGSGPDWQGRVYSYISGHRDFASTTCPGDNLYTLLPTIRTNVNNLINGDTTSPTVTITSPTSNPTYSTTSPYTSVIF